MTILFGLMGVVMAAVFAYRAYTGLTRGQTSFRTHKNIVRLESPASFWATIGTDVFALLVGVLIAAICFMGL